MTFDHKVLVKSLLAQFYEAMYLTPAARELENNMDKLDDGDKAEEALHKFITSCAGETYIVLDGLDKCPCSWDETQEAEQRKGQWGPRLSICNLLKNFLNWNTENLHLFLSSRAETDIEDVVDTQRSKCPDTVWIIDMEERRSEVDTVIGDLINATAKENRLKGSCLKEGSELLSRFKMELIQKAKDV
jgi:hypothetical protein